MCVTRFDLRLRFGWWRLWRPIWCVLRRWRCGFLMKQWWYRFSAIRYSNRTLIGNIIIYTFQASNGTISEPPMILRSWFPFNDYWEHFYTIYCVQFVVMWIGMIIVPSWNSLMVALMSYAIVALEQLNHRLQSLDVQVIPVPSRLYCSPWLKNTWFIQSFKHYHLVIMKHKRQMTITISTAT